jgi:transcriptional regulator with XRE-family HTH domain
VQVTMDVDDLGTLLRIWRSQARMTTRDVSERVLDALGRKISYMTVTRYENNEFPREGPEPAVLAALTVALGHRVSDLPVENQDSVQKLGDLILRNR